MNFSISNVTLSGVEDLIRTKAFDSAQGDSYALFSIFFALSSIFSILCSSSARGMGASYRSSAYSPTALGKGANIDMLNLPLFLMLSRPYYFRF